jgi:hypothetical protein
MVMTPLDLREMSSDCEKFNQTPPIQAAEYQRLYLRITRYAPRYLGEAADLIERLTGERDEWASKWHKVRAELAELKYPGMKGVIVPLSSAPEP